MRISVKKKQRQALPFEIEWQRKKCVYYNMKTLSILLLIGLCGCASVPLAPQGQDAAAKRFEAPPDKASVYVFRDQKVAGANIAVPVFLNRELIGGLNTWTFRRIDVDPGSHIVGVSGENGFTEMHITVAGGRNYFIRVTPMPRVARVTDLKGEKIITRCRLAM